MVTLKMLVKKHQAGKISDRKIEGAYSRFVCSKCKVIECVNHPDHEGGPFSYEDDGIPAEILKKIKNIPRPRYCVIISTDFIDSIAEGDYISDMLTDMFDEDFDEKGLVDISVQHLHNLNTDLREISVLRDEKEVIALRHLIRAVSFLLRHGNTHPSTI